MDIIEKIGTKKVFIILERSFKLTVIFFRLTNLLAIFQTIMNEILYDLINTRKIVNFINNVLVRTEIKKGPNKIVEKVIKRLAENNLYIKLEKYK